METVHNFACLHQQEGSLKMKRRYDMRIVASTFRSGNLVWLHNPQRNKDISPKLRRPWNSHTLLWNGLMMLCTGLSGALEKSLKWYTETAFESAPG